MRELATGEVQRDVISADPALVRLQHPERVSSRTLGAGVDLDAAVAAESEPALDLELGRNAGNAALGLLTALRDDDLTLSTLRGLATEVEGVDRAGSSLHDDGGDGVNFAAESERTRSDGRNSSTNHQLLHSFSFRNSLCPLPLCHPASLQQAVNHFAPFHLEANFRYAQFPRPGHTVRKPFGG